MDMQVREEVEFIVYFYIADKLVFLEVCFFSFSRETGLAVELLSSVSGHSGSLYELPSLVGW